MAEPRVIYEDNPSTILDASFERIFDRYVVTLVLHDRQSIDVTCPKGSRNGNGLTHLRLYFLGLRIFLISSVSPSISAPKSYVYFMPM